MFEQFKISHNEKINGEYIDESRPHMKNSFLIPALMSIPVAQGGESTPVPLNIAAFSIGLGIGYLGKRFALISDKKSFYITIGGGLLYGVFVDRVPQFAHIGELIGLLGIGMLMTSMGTHHSA